VIFKQLACIAINLKIEATALIANNHPFFPNTSINNAFVKKPRLIVNCSYLNDI